MPSPKLNIIGQYTKGYGRKIAFSPGGQLWAAVEPATVHLWEDDSLVDSIALPGTYIGETHFSSDGQRLYLSPHIFDLKTRSFVDLPPLRSVLTAELEKAPDLFSLNGAAWSKDGRELVIYAEYRPRRSVTRGPTYSGPRKRVLLLKGQTRELIAVLWQGSSSAEYRLLGFGERHIVAGGLPALVWDRNTHQVITELSDHATALRNLSFNGTGSRLMTADWEGRVVVWDTQSWQPAANWLAHAEGTQALAFHPQLSIVATGGDDSQLKLWDMATSPKLIASLALPGYGIGVAFHPGGQRLVVADDEGNLIICEMTGLDQ